MFNYKIKTFKKMLYLTKEQEERLEKLEQELLQKKTYDEKNRDRIMEVSKQTGIPYNLVDTDVVKIGSMLGLIQNQTRREDGKKEENLMDILFGDEKSEKPIDYSKVPPYFMLAPMSITEVEKLHFQREQVKHACNMYYTYLGTILQTECNRLHRYLTFSVQQPSVELFIETVRDNMDVIFEMLMEEEDDELWEQLRILRYALSNMIPLCEYKKLISAQILLLSKKYSVDKIFSNISYVDAKMTLFVKSEEKSDKNDINRLLHAIVIRSHNRDPELKAFDMERVKRECMNPVYMFLPLERVFHHFIMGPYNNDAIGYLRPQFYILKCITNEGVRMWILDDTLTMFSEQIRICVLRYCEKLLNTLNAKKLDVSMIERNVRFLSNSQNFRNYVCKIISGNSNIIPTEADVFDDIPSNPLNIQLPHRRN